MSLAWCGSGAYCFLAAYIGVGLEMGVFRHVSNFLMQVVHPAETSGLFQDDD